MKVGIVGSGIFGASTALALARRGHGVTVFDRAADPPADDAASADRSKALRFEYGAHCALYVPLVEESRAAYRALEAGWGAPLYVETGVLALARSWDVSRHERQSYEFLRAAGRPIELLEPDEARRRLPQFSYDGIEAVTWNPEGGYVRASEAVRATVVAARELGVEVVGGARVEGVRDRGPEAAIGLVGGTMHAFDAVVVCAGPWIQQLVPEPVIRVRPLRQFVTYYRPPDATAAARFAPPAFPVWMHDLADSGWYGMPLQDGVLKVARHEPGEPADPDAARVVIDEDREASRAFVAANIPALDSSWYAEDRGCLYAMTDDGNLVIDRVPGASSLFVAGGGSGHGFKMGPAVGRMAAGLLADGTDVPEEFRVGSARTGRVA
ncbi:MAG: FAD-dependent oxidoreductase [Candidatus Eisenbacteria bacterium]